MSKPKSVFVCAQYFAKPRNPKMTRVPGYMSDEDNIIWDERVDVTHGLKEKDLLASKVVINISEQTVVRDSFKSGKGFYELFEYFYSANPKEITQAIQRFGITIKDANESPVLEDVQGKEETTGGPERSPEA